VLHRRQGSPGNGRRVPAAGRCQRTGEWAFFLVMGPEVRPRLRLQPAMPATQAGKQSLIRARPHRPVLGQRPRRELLRLAERRTHRQPGLAQPDRGTPRHRGVHRLVQRHPAAQHTRLPHPRRIRGRNRKGETRASSLTSHQPCPSKRGNPRSACSACERPPTRIARVARLSLAGLCHTG
jgi:hypothetical protein